MKKYDLTNMKILLFPMMIALIFFFATLLFKNLYFDSKDDDTAVKRGEVVVDSLTEKDEKEAKEVIKDFIEDTLNPYYMDNTNTVSKNSKVFLYYLKERDAAQQDLLRKSNIKKKDIKNKSVSDIDYRYFSYKDGKIDVDLSCNFSVEIGGDGVEKLTSIDELNYLMKIKREGSKWKVEVATLNNDNLKNKFDNREIIDIYELTSKPYSQAKTIMDSI